MKRKWEKVNTERVFSCPYLKVDKSEFKNDANYSDDFYSLAFGDWVHVVPETVDNRILLIELYRFGVESFSIEFPGGQIEKDHTPEESAGNELLEETGCSFTSLKSIGWVYPNPAIQRNKCHFYVAKGVRKISDQNLEPAEDITVKEVTFEDLSKLVSDGKITHCLSLIAYFNYLKYLECN